MKALQLRRRVRTESGERKRLSRWIRSENREYLFMVSPVLLHLFIFAYVPMFGIVLAFKDFRYNLGILGSPWAGLDNFIFFFTSQDAWRVTRNTVGYSLIFIVTGMAVAVLLALFLYELRSRPLIKTYQTIAILPHFLSWVVVGYMTYAVFNPIHGALNGLLEGMGMEPINVYTSPEAWPFLMPILNIWKGAGMGTILYYAALMGINREYFEAARIDGASKLQVTWHISIPFLLPVMTILLILALGNVFRADFGLFYEIPRNSGNLYRTTDVIDTYVFRALREHGDIGMSAAVGLYQSIVGFVMILVANGVVRRMDPDSSLF
ncbi:MAG: ABC transporter permease [Spirochaetales bacterium]